jgi:DNA-directed RNA polymerase subunit RPC12/RpoP
MMKVRRMESRECWTMASGGPVRFTIGWIMVGIAILAVVIAGLLNSEVLKWAAVTVLIGMVVAFRISQFLGFLALEPFLGIRCPACGSRPMARTAIASFADRYYRCGSCSFRGFRDSWREWHDAGAAEYDEFYTRKRPENPWTQPPGLEDEDLIYSKTHVNLLLNKKRRNPNPPDQAAGP